MPIYFRNSTKNLTTYEVKTDVKLKKKEKEKEPTIQFSVGDYVQVSTEKSKKLVFVTKSGKANEGTLVSKMPYSEDTLSFEPDDVIANFGTNPTKAGFEVHYKSTDHDQVGKIHFFLKCSSHTKDEVTEALTKGYKQLQRKNLVSFFPVNIEIRPEKGRMLGHYKTAKKGELDTIVLRVSDSQNFLETFYHEAGHGIWRHLVTKRSTKNKWLKAFTSYVQVQKSLSKRIKTLLADLIASAQTIKEFKATLESDDDQALLKEILAYIKKHSRLTVLDLNVICEEQDQEFLTSIWPDSLALSQFKDNGISEYASKSVDEFFCESVRCYFSGYSLPDSVKKLLEKTLQQAASN